MRKQCDQKQPGVERVYSPYPSISVHHRRQRRSPEEAGAGTESWRNAAYYLASHGMPSLLFYGAQNHQPKGGTTYCGLGLSKSITTTTTITHGPGHGKPNRKHIFWIGECFQKYISKKTNRSRVHLLLEVLGGRLLLLCASQACGRPSGEE